MLYSLIVDTLLEFSIELARQAGDLLGGYFERNLAHSDLKTSLKADHSLVSEADLAADGLIAAAIHRHFPADGLLSEESQPDAFHNPAESNGALWIIDPLDGTTNFSLGLHVWGVLITRLEGGVPAVTAMYFPRINELYTAVHGQGALLNRRPLHAPQSPWTSPTPFFSCCSRTFRRYHVSVPYKARILGSAAYSLACVARGVARLSFESTAKIWDIAGSWLLVQEAGGVMGTLDGSQPFPLQPNLPFASQSYPTLAAPSQELLDQAHHQIQPKKT